MNEATRRAPSISKALAQLWRVLSDFVRSFYQTYAAFVRSIVGAARPAGAI